MEREDLKKQLRIDKVQLGHILLCAGGILVPALCVLLGFCLTFTPKITVSLALSPRSLFAMFGRTGVNPPVTFVPEMKGMLIVLCFSAAVWAGTAVFSVLALALPALRAEADCASSLRSGSRSFRRRSFSSCLSASI